MRRVVRRALCVPCNTRGHFLNSDRGMVVQFFLVVNNKVERNKCSYQAIDRVGFKKIKKNELLSPN